MTLNELRASLIKQARVYVYNEKIANEAVVIPGTSIETHSLAIVLLI